MKTVEYNIKPIMWKGRVDLFVKMFTAAMLALLGKEIILSISARDAGESENLRYDY